MFDNLIFDLDGTLINSVPDITYSINETLKIYNLPSVTEDLVKSFVGDGSRILARRMINFYKDELSVNDDLDDLVEDFLEKYKKIYSNNLTKFSYLYNNVSVILKEFRKYNKKMFLLTNKPENWAIEVLRYFNILDFFIEVKGATDNPVKPNIDIFLKWKEYYKLDNQKTVIIGDGKADMEFGINAEIFRIACLYGYTHKDILLSYDPEFVLFQFEDVYKIIL